MYDQIDKIIFSREEIEKKVRELGEKISLDYKDQQEILLIGILKSSLFFLSDLMRQVSRPLIIDFIEVAGYSGTKGNTGPIKILKDIEEDIGGKHIVIVEDIVDTGLTLNFVLKHLYAKKPASIKTCILTNKTNCRLVDIPLDYVGFETSEPQLVGYGSDLEDKYRHYPFICKIKV